MNDQIAKFVKHRLKTDLLVQLAADHLFLCSQQAVINLLAKHKLRIKRLFQKLEYAIFVDQYHHSILTALWNCLQLLQLISQKAIAFATQAYLNHNAKLQWSFAKWYQFYLFGSRINYQNPEVQIWIQYEQNLFWIQFADPIATRDYVDQCPYDSFTLGQALIDYQLQQLQSFYQLQPAKHC